MKHSAILLVTLVVAACASQAGSTLPAPSAVASIPPVSGAEQERAGLRYIDVVFGTGASAETRKCVYVHYTGWLTNGRQFDSSRQPAPDGSPAAPIGFPLGTRRVIEGWDVGIEGMRVGGKRRLLIPSRLGYGARGAPPAIPPNSDLVFDVELMATSEPIRRQSATSTECTPWR